MDTVIVCLSIYLSLLSIEVFSELQTFESTSIHKLDPNNGHIEKGKLLSHLFKPCKVNHKAVSIYDSPGKPDRLGASDHHLATVLLLVHAGDELVFLLHLLNRALYHVPLALALQRLSILL